MRGHLKKNEIIRPDAAAGPRRPGGEQHQRHPRGVRVARRNWLELEDRCRTNGRRRAAAVAGDMPFKLEGGVKLVPEDAARRPKLLDFMKACAAARSTTRRRRHTSRFSSAARRLAEVPRDHRRLCNDSLLSDFLYLDGQARLAERTSRLSFFCGTTRPTRRQQTKRLAKPKRLRRQVDRMLDDPRAARFVDSFLTTDKTSATSPRRRRNPFAGLLPRRRADRGVRFETRIFTELIAKDLPARDVVDSDFIFANERLAKLWAGAVRGHQATESRTAKARHEAA